MRVRRRFKCGRPCLPKTLPSRRGGPSMLWVKYVGNLSTSRYRFTCGFYRYEVRALRQVRDYVERLGYEDFKVTMPRSIWDMPTSKR